MSDSPKQRRRQDIAYFCFLVPAAGALLGAIGSLLASGFDIEPASLGFFVLIPIALVSIVAIPVAIVLTFMIGRRDRALILLAVASVVVVAAGLAELGGETFAFGVLPVLYGLLVAGVAANWFLVRRKTPAESETAETHSEPEAPGTAARPGRAANTAVLTLILGVAGFFILGWVGVLIAAAIAACVAFLRPGARGGYRGA